MARQSLKAAVRKSDAGKAAQVAKKLSFDTDRPPTEDEFFETVSYNLPVDLIDLARELA